MATELNPNGRRGCTTNYAKKVRKGYRKVDRGERQGGWNSRMVERSPFKKTQEEDLQGKVSSPGAKKREIGDAHKIDHVESG